MAGVSLRSQTLYTAGGPQALELVGSDGRVFTLTKQQVQDFYQSTTGNAASRRAQVIAWVKSSAVTALGAETLDQNQWTLDFSLVTGGIDLSRFGSTPGPY